MVIFLHKVQTEVNNYFKSHSDDVYKKIQKAAELSDSTDMEDAALLLTEVRRSLKAVADYLYPATSEQIVCTDGKERKMGDDQYLNRLFEYVLKNVTQSTSKDLLQNELNYLVSFIERLNKIGSKGVHSEVTIVEAKQGLVGLYFFLFNLCQKITEK